MNNKTRKIINIIRRSLAGGMAVLLGLFVAVFLYFDRGNEITVLIQAWGAWGIVLAVFLMATLFMTPVPSEGLIVIYLKIYGAYLGTLYSWLGSMISSIAFFYIARTYAQKPMEKLITKERFKTVDNWVKEKGTIGLLTARFLPIPAFFVNCIVGTMPSIKIWPFFWTATVAIIPYFVGIALVFLGVSNGTWKWTIIGAIIELACISTGYFITRKKR